jgi:hypothetical protein
VLPNASGIIVTAIVVKVALKGHYPFDFGDRDRTMGGKEPMGFRRCW